MKIDKLVGSMFKERPSECDTDGYAFMVRGGYMKSVSNGIYSLYMPLRRIIRKIEQILRDEMDIIGGQEVMFIGESLLPSVDADESSILSHEEAAVLLVKDCGNSYANYPFMIYQMHTDFRDEQSSRGGLIRAREFIVKDAFSFHESPDDLHQFSEKCLSAYERVFARVGLSGLEKVVASDKIEFMLATTVGDEWIAKCNCGFCARVEETENIVTNNDDAPSGPIALLHTPNVKTVEELCKFTQRTKEKICKAVVYQRDDGSFIIVFIRGDLEVDDKKLERHLKSSVQPAVIEEDSGIIAGYIGPFKLNGNKHVEVLFDKSLQGAKNLICGGNQFEYHYADLDMTRDIEPHDFFDFAAIADGDMCPKCHNASLTLLRGVVVGSITLLGTEYPKAMGMQYLDSNGALSYPSMGHYSVEIGRLAALVCEEHHDENGPIWPMAIAPWQVHLCAVRSDNKEVKIVADMLYDGLSKKGIEVIYDDRSVSAGVMFSTADLLGVPYRVVVSPRNIKESCCEISSRDKQLSFKQPLELCGDKIIELVESAR